MQVRWSTAAARATTPSQATEVMPSAKPRSPSLAQEQPGQPPSLDPSAEPAKPAGEPTEQPASPRPAEGVPADKRADGEAGGRAASFAAADADTSLRAARVYFNVDPMGQKLGAIEPWAPGEEPRFEAADIAASNNANVKLATLPPGPWPAGKPGSIFDAPVARRSATVALRSKRGGEERGGRR